MQSTYPHTSTGNKQQALQPPTQTHKPTKHCKTANFHGSSAPCGHPKAASYEEKVQHLIYKACYNFEACLVAFDATPEPEKQICWVKEAWDSIAEGYELTNRIITILMLFSVMSLSMQLIIFVDSKPDISCMHCNQGCCSCKTYCALQAYCLSWSRQQQGCKEKQTSMPGTTQEQCFSL